MNKGWTAGAKFWVKVPKKKLTTTYNYTESICTAFIGTAPTRTPPIIIYSVFNEFETLTLYASFDHERQWLPD
ncbi:MAG: hypothetical protein ACI358_02345 [Candidatus Limimorpha sp.]